MTKIALQAGELYFIGERDRHSGELTPYVKIGLVGSTRTSADRLTEHRTASPRQLVVHAVVPTPLVRWAENTIHKQFAAQRIHGEWFVLDDARLAEAISEARLLADALGPLVALIDRAQTLGGLESDGTTIPATDDVRAWLRDLRSAAARVERCEELRSRYSRVVTVLVEAGEVGPEIATTKVVPRPKFDEKSFEASHPDLWARYLREVDRGVQGSFRKSGGGLPPIEEVDPGLAAFGLRFAELCDEAVSDGDSMEALKDAFLELDWRRRAADLDQEVAEARIKTACGTADAIEGVCTWRRRREVKPKFDEKAFAEAEPELHAKFLVEKLTQRTDLNRKGQDQSSGQG